MVKNWEERTLGANLHVVSINSYKVHLFLSWRAQAKNDIIYQDETRNKNIIHFQKNDVSAKR